MNTDYSKPWVQRHWILVLVLALGAMLVLMAGIGAMAAYSLMASMKQSPVYVEAMSKARASAELAEVLGRPIEDSGWVVGSTQQQNGEGHAFVVIPVYGPKGEGSVHAEATLHDGVWTYTSLRAKPDHGSRFIDLRETDAAAR
jgi:hypothetical protein